MRFGSRSAVQNKITKMNKYFMNYSMDPSASQILSGERINAQILYGILWVFMIQRINHPELNLDIIVSKVLNCSILQPL